MTNIFFQTNQTALKFFNKIPEQIFKTHQHPTNFQAIFTHIKFKNEQFDHFPPSRTSTISHRDDNEPQERRSQRGKSSGRLIFTFWTRPPELEGGSWPTRASLQCDTTLSTVTTSISLRECASFYY